MKGNQTKSLYNGEDSPLTRHHIPQIPVSRVSHWSNGSHNPLQLL